MKKTIIIIILVIYIASIAIVNFFGLETKLFDGITYVDSISCASVTLQNETPVELYPSSYIGTNNTPLFIFDFIPSQNGDYTMEPESILSNPNAVQINYEVFPHNADILLSDGKSVKFEYDSVAMSGVAMFHEESNSLIFLKPLKMFTVTIRSADGSNKSTTISIMGRVPKN